MASREQASVTERAPSRSGTYRIEAVTAPADLAKHVPAWEALAAVAAEPNVFYEPWMLLPAVRAFGRGRTLVFVFVYRDDPAGGPPTLCGFFPFERRRHYRGLPATVMTLWTHLHCFLSTPLLRRGTVKACLRAVLSWAATARRGAALVELKQVGGDGPLQKSLDEHVESDGSGVFVYGDFQRALFVPLHDAESYLRGVLSPRSRRDLRRRRRRLAERGRLVFDVLGPDGDAGTWAEEFLELEASGWKGHARTALACTEAGRRFFLEVTREAHARGRLVMVALRLDGRAVAAQCNLRAGDGAFSFKIAYDERHARFAPGVLLEMDNVRALHEMPEIRWMDSCTIAGNEVANRLRLHRRRVRSVVIATGRAFGHVVVAALPTLARVSRRVRRRGAAAAAIRNGGGLLTCVALPAF